MDIGVVGLGHVGLVSAACFAEVGHNVVGMDVMPERLQELAAGRVPFYEPSLQDLVTRHRESGRLRFESSLPPLVEASEAIFICVGTPSLPSGEADLSQVEAISTELASCLDHRYRVLVEKSTVPVNTGGQMLRTIGRLTDARFDVVSNPEFLREGSAVRDTLCPDRVVVGGSSPTAFEVMRRVFAPIVERSGCEVIETDVKTAELIKHASNAFLATKISFINHIAEICDRVGANVDLVADGMGLDPRIGRSFLDAGVGYGGSCFPKDVAAFAVVADEATGDASLLRAVQAINARGPKRLIERLRSELWYLKGKRIAVLGLSFKPGTDDLRDSPAFPVIEELLASEAQVVAYDPVAMPGAKERLSPKVRYATSALDALEDAHAAVIVTGWPEFAELDPARIRRALRLPIVIDGRNIFELDKMAEAGLTYLSMGRPPVHPST
jgi:UDPglucose 6-dehydrogenase